MKFNRKSIRLRAYDYSQEGAYFMTICSYNHKDLFWKKHIFGENMVSSVRLNEIGLMIDKWWKKMFEKYCNEIEMDEYVIMPNHMHGIIKIVANPSRGESMYSPQNKSKIKNTYEGIGRYISWFKRMTTNEYIRNVKNKNFPVFNNYIWQRNYYEHIVRDINDLNNIRQYIINNPTKWTDDKYFSKGYMYDKQ